MRQTRKTVPSTNIKIVEKEKATKADSTKRKRNTKKEGSCCVSNDVVVEEKAEVSVPKTKKRREKVVSEEPNVRVLRGRRLAVV